MPDMLYTFADGSSAVWDDESEEARSALHYGAVPSPLGSVPIMDEEEIEDDGDDDADADAESHVTVLCTACGYVSEYVNPSSSTCLDCGACLCDECQMSRSNVSEENDAYDEDYDTADYGDDAANETETVVVSETMPLAFSTRTPRLMLPALPGRSIRSMSFEQEIAAGCEEISSALYDSGFSPFRNVKRYGSSEYAEQEHEGRVGGASTFAHVENDSSCGGEIIYSRLDLSDNVTAERFEEAFALVRSYHASGEIVLNAHCGFHVHVGIQGFGMRAIENLYHVHNYLEDILYRLGSANWSAHRTEINDEDYSPTVAKNLATRARIGEWMSGNRSALNLSNYFAARSSCSCGAFAFSDWESCSCDLPKATVEFRWPNATANLRKVHAYASLLQALVGAAEFGDDGAFAHLEALSFEGTHNEPPFYAWEERVSWMSRNLALTSSEIDSIAHCFARSSFGVHGEALGSLLSEGVTARV